MKPTILFLFNSSTYACQPWLDDGRFNVVSVDYDETDHAGEHRKDTEIPGLRRFNIDLSKPFAASAVMRELWRWGYEPPSLVISFAPCTDLSVAGARHFAAKAAKDPHFQDKAVRMAKLASHFPCAYMVENPVSVLSTKWRKPDFTFHPYEFSGYLSECDEHPEYPNVIPARDAYNKKTCLWYGQGFVPPIRFIRSLPDDERNPGWAKLGGKSARTKHIRSLTPRGFAQAVYVANYLKILREFKG